MKEEIIVNILKKMVYECGADKIWMYANQLLLFLTDEKEGEGKLSQSVIKEFGP